jgi:predicted amidohydrolase YtcJ
VSAELGSEGWDVKSCPNAAYRSGFSRHPYSSTGSTAHGAANSVALRQAGFHETRIRRGTIEQDPATATTGILKALP